MKSKFEVFQIFIFFIFFFHLIQNQFGKKHQKLNHEFHKLFSYNDIILELTCVNTPQQNKVAQRNNYYLLVVARALFSQMSISETYWREVMIIVTYLINRLLSCVLMTLVLLSLNNFCSLFSPSATLSCQVFGCVVFVHSHNPNRNKLYSSVLKCVLVDYPSNKKGYRCYHLHSHCIFITMDVTFDEIKYFLVSQPLKGKQALEAKEFSFMSLPYLSLHTV